MSTTFYGVLGVGPDADAAAIRSGYRERATDVHPDVNDDPDADSQFRRLTTAKETLLDETERARYDRLGHASYVRHHVTCTAWSADAAAESGSTVNGDAESTGRNVRNATYATPSRSASGTASRRGDFTDGRRHSEAGSGTAAHGRNRGNTASRRSTATANSGDDAPPWSGRESRDHSARDSGSRRSVSDTYATSSFWDSQRVGERRATGARHADPLFVRLCLGVRTLGLWAIVHALFLSLAVGTSWYVYAVVMDGSVSSLPVLLFLVGEVALALVLSIVHVFSRVYR